MADFPMASQDDMDAMDESECGKLIGRYVLPQNADATVALWLQKLKAGILSTAHFRDYWRITVPRVYSPELNASCLAWSFDDDRASALLLSPLEKFICGGEDPQDALLKLAHLDKGPSVCGKVFKMGEPAYSCRECGMDNTCVLCVECFKNSLHRLHKYKIGTSTGGGCCDCGDVEAWRSEPFCDIHVVGTLSEEPTEGLPDDMIARTREVFSATLGYCYQLLTLEEHSPCLPTDLRLRENEQCPLEQLEQPDSFCTVLYNDETHTFEQVISTLTRVIKCTQREAVEYVTNIDREGRAVVKCASLQHCNELKQEIERYTARHGNKSLKVHVVHTHVIAHQIFAMKLLQWIQSFLTYSEGFRKVLSASALAPRLPEATIAEGVLLRDCQLWKAARTSWHRLLIAGMLMDYDSKRALASVFIKNYGSMIKDFIRDDHDHAFSVSSLSVQIYTVPTLAHHLIANEDALFILLNTFLSECSRKCNAGKLEFARNTSNTGFKRAQYILYDLKYLLSVKPDTWTDALRKGFLQGLSLILNLLTMMQGMDAVVRQVGQHMEFEPEWESAFNLHIKLATVISVVLEWCGTDKVVLVKAYRATLKQLHSNPPASCATAIPKELADHSATCIQYDVANQPVSIHLPLSRFLSGLHLQLHNFGLTFDSSEFHMPSKPSPEQIIEPVLRTQAMISQVHAGMWRRNGYALLNQLYFYHNVKCRSEMLDRDIVLLQVGASLIERNEYLIHLLNKFNLVNWAQSDFEAGSSKSNEDDSIRQTISLVEEFLGLLITIIGERHMSGVSECTMEERTKKEIIQQLCGTPLSHSELNRTLPEDQLHETGLENVIDEIAEFKKPANGKGCGVYSLRPNFYPEYNVFFYHYTREELSKSEEVQRKRRKNAGELECCPPPDLPRLASSFSMLADLLQCDVMLHIMGTVLSRCLDLHARSFSEMQLHKVLHLMGMALQEEESGRYPFLVFSERAARAGLTSHLAQLQNSPRVEAHKDLLTWTLNKFRSIAVLNKDIPAQTQCESVPFKSTEDANSPPQETEKERRARLAAEKRAKVMAQMQAMQHNFMKENANLFDVVETDPGKKDEQMKSKVRIHKMQTRSNKTMSTVEPINIIFRPAVQVIGGGGTTDSPSVMDVSPPSGTSFMDTNIPETSIPEDTSESTHTCILCQEDTQVTMNGPLLVLAGFIQQSTVLLSNKTGEAIPTAAGICLASTLAPAPHISTCGHVMHSHCWQKYYDNVVNKENRRPYRLRQPAAFNVDRQEYLCPLCECISNIALPLIPSLKSLQSKSETEIIPDISFPEWVSGLHVIFLNVFISKFTKQITEEQSQLDPENATEPQPSASKPTMILNKMLSYPVEDSAKELGKINQKYYAIFPKNVPHFNDEPKSFIQLFASGIYSRGLGGKSFPGDVRIVPVAWSGVTYTLHSIDAVSQASNRPLFGHLPSRHRDCLQALIRIAGVLGTISVKQEIINDYAFQLLNPFMGSRTSCETCILDWDSVGYLIALTMSHPSLFINDHEVSPIPPDNIINQHICKLVLLISIVKIMITADFNNCASDVKMDDKCDNESSAVESDAESLPKLFMIFKKTNRKIDTSVLDEQLTWNVIKKGCLTFLRNACTFYHFLFDIPAPIELTEKGGDTFENMCSFLGLPSTFDEIFCSTTECNLASEWCQHSGVIQYLEKMPLLDAPRQLQPHKLVTLPHDYSELINTVSLFTCPNSDREDSRNPTMCLICGKMLCSQSYCCQIELNKVPVGACTYHTHKCGSGAGIFLRVRECEILLLAAPAKGCVAPPPYVDQYGETDQGLRRGNPLHLCEDRYNKLQMLWLNHGIHEEIARSIESNTSLMNPTWQHL